MVEKICPHCKISKPLEEFHPDPTRKLGVGSWCKQCVAERKRTKYSVALSKDPEYIKEQEEIAKGNKWCNICKQYKPLSEFSKDSCDCSHH